MATCSETIVATLRWQDTQVVKVVLCIVCISKAVLLQKLRVESIVGFCVGIMVGISCRVVRCVAFRTSLVTLWWTSVVRRVEGPFSFGFFEFILSVKHLLKVFLAARNETIRKDLFGLASSDRSCFAYQHAATFVERCRSFNIALVSWVLERDFHWRRRHRWHYQIVRRSVLQVV